MWQFLRQMFSVQEEDTLQRAGQGLLGLSVSRLAPHSWKEQGMPIALLRGPEAPSWKEVGRDGL